MENTVCGARADFQTAGLNGVFAHFCRRGQKWVAPERETSPCRLLKEMGPPEAGKRGDYQIAHFPPQAASVGAACWAAKDFRRMQRQILPHERQRG